MKKCFWGEDLGPWRREILSFWSMLHVSCENHIYWLYTAMVETSWLLESSCRWPKKMWQDCGKHMKTSLNCRVNWVSASHESFQAPFWKSTGVISTMQSWWSETDCPMTGVQQGCPSCIQGFPARKIFKMTWTVTRLTEETKSRMYKYTNTKNCGNYRKYNRWNHGATSLSSVVIDQKPDNVSCGVKMLICGRGYEAIASTISLSQIGSQVNFARLWAPL